MGKVLDGVAGHMNNATTGKSFRIAPFPEPSQTEVAQLLQERRIDVLVNFLPVGSEEATSFYVGAALKAGVGIVNAIPVFLASDKVNWVARFAEAGVPIIGDDIKSQVGATVLHRTLEHLFVMRGANVARTYQLNVGGNTDFRNMQDASRLTSKRLSKTRAVQSVEGVELCDEDLFVGPAAYIPWQGDKKVAFIRLEGTVFSGAPVEVEVRLSVEDSANSAGVVIDAIRCIQLARDRGISGALVGPSAYCCKHPPQQMSESRAWKALQSFIREEHHQSIQNTSTPF